MKEGLYTKKLKADRIICSLCHHQCLVPPDAKGVCDVRENKSGKFYALNYEKITKEGIIPVEKVATHFLSGSDTYAVGTVGENFQEYEELPTKKATGEQLVKRALRQGCVSISFLYNEPTMSFEMVHEAAKFARSNRLKVLMKSNLYVQEKPMKELLKTIHCFNVLLPTVDKDKFAHLTGGKLFPVQKNIQAAVQEKNWVEITSEFNEDTNLGDVHQLAEYISFLDKHIPWHVRGPLVEEAKRIGKEHGLVYIYGPQDTLHCPHCNKSLMNEEEVFIEKDACEFCKRKMHGVF